MFFKEIGKMGHFLKTQTERDFGNVPICVVEQYFGFLKYSCMDYRSCCAAGSLFEYFIEVVGMYGQALGKVIGGFQQQSLRWCVYRELSFQ